MFCGGGRVRIGGWIAVITWALSRVRCLVLEKAGWNFHGNVCEVFDGVGVLGGGLYGVKLCHENYLFNLFIWKCCRLSLPKYKFVTFPLCLFHFSLCP